MRSNLISTEKITESSGVKATQYHDGPLLLNEYKVHTGCETKVLGGQGNVKTQGF